MDTTVEEFLRAAIRAMQKDVAEIKATMAHILAGIEFLKLAHAATQTDAESSTIGPPRLAIT